MEHRIICPEHGGFPCMVVDDRPLACAVAGAATWLDEAYHDPDETEYLVELLRDELLKAWQQNAVLTECVRQHVVELPALIDWKDAPKA